MFLQNVMKRNFFSCLIYIALMAAFIMPAQAVRYLGDHKDAPKIENLLNILRVQQEELERLMNMLSRLDTWKKRLSNENTRLYEEGELAKQDRKKFEEGKMTELALNKKWATSGRSIRHDKDMQLFEKDVSEFNAYVKEYNQLTKKMSHVLDSRNPTQVKLLIKEIRKLSASLGRAMSDGNIEKARYIARKSAIAAEFGYSEK
jgi:hypothetical protein